MAAMKAAFNATSVPDEPVPEYNELLEEEVRAAQLSAVSTPLVIMGRQGAGYQGVRDTP